MRTGPAKGWLFSALTALALSALACGSPAAAPGPSSSPTAAPPAAQPTQAAAAPTAAAPAASTQFAPDSYMAQLVKRGKIIIGVKYDAPPFGNLNPLTNKVEGFDIDVAKEITKALFNDDSKVEFTEAISKNRLPFLEEDKTDLIISTMTITDDRKKEIDFSDVYYLAGQSTLVKKGSPIKSITDTAGKTVCSATGSTSEQNIREKSPQAKLLLFDNYSLCQQALNDGRADAVSTDDTILMGMVMKDPSLQMVGGNFTEEPYGIGIKKGRPEFVKFVNDVLTAMKKDGRWKEIYQRNIGKVTGFNPEPPK